MNKYFKCEVKYTQNDEQSGEPKLVTENFLVSAINYTEAELLIHTEMEMRLKAQTFTVSKIEKARITDVLNKDGEKIFWLAKAAFFVQAENSIKDKKIVENLLVNAADIKDAIEKVTVFYKSKAVPDTKVIGAAESNIVEVLN